MINNISLNNFVCYAVLPIKVVCNISFALFHATLGCCGPKKRKKLKELTVIALTPEQIAFDAHNKLVSKILREKIEKTIFGINPLDASDTEEILHPGSKRVHSPESTNTSTPPIPIPQRPKKNDTLPSSIIRAENPLTFFKFE